MWFINPKTLIHWLSALLPLSKNTFVCGLCQCCSYHLPATLVSSLSALLPTRWEFEDKALTTWMELQKTNVFFSSHFTEILGNDLYFSHKLSEAQCMLYHSISDIQHIPLSPALQIINGTPLYLCRKTVTKCT